MAQPNQQIVVITKTRGEWAAPDGSGGALPAFVLPDDTLASALNVDLGPTWGICKRRNGARSLGMHADLTTAVTFLAVIYRGINTSSGPARLVVASSGDETGYIFYSSQLTSGSTPSWGKAALPTGETVGSNWFGRRAVCSANNVLYFPNNAFTYMLALTMSPASIVCRWAGLAAPAAPTAADSGSGTYAATIRYYRVRYTAQTSGVTLRRSEPSAVTTFTPSGSGALALITKPAALTTGWYETHWELEASADNVTFYRIATSTAATGSYNDSADPATYATAGTLSEPIGEYTLLPPCRFVCADTDRLVLAHQLTPTATTWYPGRVYWTPRLAASGVGNLERCPPANYLDVGLLDQEVITGLCAGFLNSVIVSTNYRLIRLVPTGDDSVPYEQSELSGTFGATPSGVAGYYHNLLLTAAAGEQQRALFFPLVSGDVMSLTEESDPRNYRYDRGYPLTLGRPVDWSPYHRAVVFRDLSLYWPLRDALARRTVSGVADTTNAYYEPLVIRGARSGVGEWIVVPKSSSGLLSLEEDDADRLLDVATAFTASIRTHHLPLCGLGQRGTLKRLRVWGQYLAGLKVTVYRDQATIGDDIGVLQEDGGSTTRFTLPIPAAGTAETFAFSFEDNGTPLHRWIIDAIELVVTPQEPVRA